MQNKTIYALTLWIKYSIIDLFFMPHNLEFVLEKKGVLREKSDWCWIIEVEEKQK